MRSIRPLPDLELPLNGDSVETLLRQQDAVRDEIKNFQEVERVTREMQRARLRNLRERHRNSEERKELLRQHLDEERQREIANSPKPSDNKIPPPPSVALVGGPLEKSLMLAHQKLNELDHEWNSSMREAKRQMKSIELQRILNGENTGF
eukprot:TRINITY_DN37400_c0_g1_i1.p1 TRINITY_DN37400_c0_g1~~TRINITY_DN37400_c0_g1_i1.p1  ORF type:complete len:150 (+),score=21.10 TRINITY_DN37400_c0_g1_i1:52-501(+)